MPQAPRYDDDDVVEEYDVLDATPSSSRSPSGKSSSAKPPAQGGPVLRKQPSQQGAARRPSAPVTPGPEAQAEGDVQYVEEAGGQGARNQISAKNAKMIWAICIGITVLGLGAVIGDIAFDIFGRRAGGLPVSNTNTRKSGGTPKGTPERPKNPDEVKALEFKGLVQNEMQRIRQKKVYKFFEQAYAKFREARTNAFDKKASGDGKDARDAAWAEAIKGYYEATYALRLLEWTYKQGADEDFMTAAKLDDLEELVGLVKSNAVALKKEANIRYQAAYSIISAYSRDIKDFRSGWISKDVEVNNVYSSDKYKAVFADAKLKCEKAEQMSPEFDPKDLEAVKD